MRGVTLRHLFIHIGPHKTGTTSIQAFLARNHLELQKRGVAVYFEEISPGVVGANVWALAHCFIRPELQTPMRLLRPVAPAGSAAATQQVQRFRDWSERQTAPTCIVSSETFSFLRTDQEAGDLKRALSGLFDRVSPILTLRNPTDWRRSWNHQLHTMAVWDRIATLPDDARVDGAWYFDIVGLRRFWGQFGQVVELDYAAALQGHGSIIPPFRSTIGISGPELDDDIFLNVSERRTATADNKA